MSNYKIELNLYQDCLYEIKRRTDVVADHINKVTTEKYLIVEVETVCLQFRKILEKIALMSLVANKELYAAQNQKFARHYHAERIMRDLERINPDFYPVPIKRIQKDNEPDELIEVKDGYLTKEDFIKIYEKCGGLMHAQNPFASEKPVEEIPLLFPVWLTKICNLINHHRIQLVGGKAMVVALMKRSDNGLPQAVIFEKMD
jgi:hypothetical protein